MAILAALSKGSLAPALWRAQKLEFNAPLNRRIYTSSHGAKSCVAVKVPSAILKTPSWSRPTATWQEIGHQGRG